MKWEDILNVLIELQGRYSGVKGATIVSTEGLPNVEIIGSTFFERADETRFAAMITSLLSLAERSVIEMKKGLLDHLFVKGTDGSLLVLRAGPNAVLAVSTTKDVRFGLIFLDCKRICEKIRDLI